jgi:hypothetical protein
MFAEMIRSAEKRVGQIKKVAIFITAFAHLYLAATLAFQKEFENSVVQPVFIAWIPGTLTFVFNLIYARMIQANRGYLVALILSGIVWAFPLLAYNIIGIPLLIVYLYTVFKVYHLPLPELGKRKTVVKNKSRKH